MSGEKNDFKEFSIRVPIELYEKIESDSLSAKPKRSRNSQVNFIIESYYETVEGGPVMASANEVALAGE